MQQAATPKGLRRLLQGKRGQSLVEFALVLPVLMIIVLGVIDFGRAYFAFVSVTNAARNGAHYASASPAAAADLAGIEAAAREDINNVPNPGSATVATSTGTDTQGNMYADVTVSYPFNTLFPWPGIPDSFDIERTVRSRVAQ